MRLWKKNDIVWKRIPLSKCSQLELLACARYCGVTKWHDIPLEDYDDDKLLCIVSRLAKAKKRQQDEILQDNRSFTDMLLGK